MPTPGARGGTFRFRSGFFSAIHEGNQRGQGKSRRKPRKPPTKRKQIGQENCRSGESEQETQRQRGHAVTARPDRVHPATPVDAGDGEAGTQRRAGAAGAQLRRRPSGQPPGALAEQPLHRAPPTQNTGARQGTWYLVGVELRLLLVAKGARHGRPGRCRSAPNGG